MKVLKIVAIAILFSLVGCDKNSVYKQFDSGFDDNRWLRTDVKTYEFTLEKPGAYDLLIDFSHVAGIQFAQIPLQIEITSPDGAIAAEKVILQTKDSQGNDLGDCAGDLCDMQQSVSTNRQWAAGNYKIRLSNEFDNDYLPNVIGVGIRVKISGTE